MKPITWANGFGIWHVRVSRTAASPLIAARRALRDELQARESASAPVAREIYMHPVHVPELDDAETIVYREGEACAHRHTSRISDDERSCDDCGDRVRISVQSKEATTSS